MDRPAGYFEPAPIVMPVFPERPGVLASVDCRAVGLAVVELGGGRKRVEDRVDPRVGFTELAGLGQEVGAERPLAMVHAASAGAAEAAAAQLRAACVIGDTGKAGPVVRKQLTPADL